MQMMETKVHTELLWLLSGYSIEYVGDAWMLLSAYSNIIVSSLLEIMTMHMSRSGAEQHDNKQQLHGSKNSTLRWKNHSSGCFVCLHYWE